MNCSNCNKGSKILHGERWSNGKYIIYKGEYLCDDCAKKRGAKSLQMIYQEFKKKRNEINNGK